MSSTVETIVDNESVLLTEELVGEAAAGGGSEPPRRHGAFSALEVPAFARFWWTLVLSLTGTWVRITAMGVLVYDLTDNEFYLGLISFVQAVPQLIVGPLAGAFLDRVDRRKVLIGVQITTILSMAVVTALIATDTIQFWHLVIISLVIGVAVGFDWPARLSLAPLLVDRSRLQSAVAINAAAFNGARVLGPSIAGWMIGAVGIGVCFGFTSLSAVPFLIVLLTLSVSSIRLTVSERPPAETIERESPLKTLLEGYRYIWRTPKLRGLLTVDIVPIALGSSYATMAPAIAKDVLDLGDGGLGWLLTANGIGSLLGTLAVAFMAGMRGRGRLVIWMIGAFAITVVVFGLSSSVWVSLPAILLLGLGFSMYGTTNDTLVQTIIDEDYRGRVVSVQTMLWGLTPIGGLLSGILAELINVQWAVAISGILVLLYVPYLWFFTPVRHIE